MSDLKIESNIPLLELPDVAGEESDCVFDLLPGPVERPAPTHWLHQWLLPRGEIWLSIAKQEDTYLLRFPAFADFLVSANGKEIRCYPIPNTPLETIKHLLLDQVMPLVLSKQGRLVIHASTVVAPEGAIAFVGTTGQGKSTLAASFSMHGFPLMTDDCLLLEEKEGQLLATPSYPGVRLWDDVIDSLFDHQPAVSDVAHYTDKKRLTMNNSRLLFCADSVPVRRIYCLTPRQEGEEVNTVTIAPLSARDAFMELVSCTFKLDITDQELLKKEFQLFGRVAALPIFYRLTFPHDFSLLSTVREAILSNVHEA